MEDVKITSTAKKRKANWSDRLRLMATNSFSMAVHVISNVICWVTIFALLLILNPIILWLSALLSKAGMRLAVETMMLAEKIGLDGLYLPLLNRLPLFRKILFPEKFYFSEKEQRKIAKECNVSTLLELNTLEEEFKHELLLNNPGFRHGFIDKAGMKFCSDDVDLIYSSSDGAAVKKILTYRCPSAFQAERLLENKLQHLLPVYAEYHTPGYTFLQKVKTEAPEYYQQMLEILNDKADALMFEKGDDEAKMAVVRKKLGLRGQKAVIKSRNEDYVCHYLQHNAIDETLMMTLAFDNSCFAKITWQNFFLMNHELSEEAKTVLRQGPHAHLIS